MPMPSLSDGLSGHPHPIAGRRKSFSASSTYGEMRVNAQSTEAVDLESPRSMDRSGSSDLPMVDLFSTMGGDPRRANGHPSPHVCWWASSRHDWREDGATALGRDL